MEPLIHGSILAFGLILPLGAQNIFLFNQGAAHKYFMHALPAVITAGVCDTLLIYSAVAGVSLIVFSFEWLKNLLFIIGFFFLSYMGWVMWKSSTEALSQQIIGFSAKRQVAFAASVSLLNPHAIMDTVGVIGTSSLVYSGVDKWSFTLACVSVSWIWFLGLAIAGKMIRQLDGTGNILKRINQLSACMVWGMALYMGYQAIQPNGLVQQASRWFM
ncbi:LysE/ArgO family amino acid transporter [Planococcus sp. N028]|uniref:LysE/ArgO family amino acid transporter n=1 Tax=Planococcus shixiaomingii TaxID=3058393 RepID=A0ABT8N3L0_9BACL|nr:MULTISPECIES: LysE/ArgO family amino acid transporter [unclassified Planococcus (in: firmicutes)]MDN7242472.1 LysE/ArgO family amino acid transporter [Planococcus sp. N028]WKA54712.1 LysE/ArgO family amino acid transporter [Planococcus sp. N022]